MNILTEIVESKKKRIDKTGLSMGAKIPLRRKHPVVPFGKPPLLICEIKKASPSKGKISSTLDPVFQANEYVKRGINTVSILTESEYFSGSLDDLIKVKNSFPELCILRKDFLIYEEEIDISHRAGADVVLLIASIHDTPTLRKLYTRAKRLGLAVIFEIHDDEDLAKASEIRPAITGFNSRDLRSFRIDPIRPIRLRQKLSWDTITIFESGIGSREDAELVLSGGFSGMLVGEAVVKNTSLIDEIIPVFSKPKKRFWEKLFRRKRPGRPLVKICGITNIEDAICAAGEGADILGFVFAESPRKAGTEIVESCSDLDIIRAGVVVPGSASFETEIEKVRGLLNDGLLDAVQFHGNHELPSFYETAFPYYRALRIARKEDIELIARCRSPRVLVDTFVPDMEGGTGRRIPDSIIQIIKEKFPLWLAGGIGGENVGEIIRKFSPELIDVSSRLEKQHGVKDHRKIKILFKEIQRATDI